MAKRSKQEQQIISRKIIFLKGEGYARKQATAIAMRMHRDGELPRPIKPPKPPNRLRKRTRPGSTTRSRR